MTMVSLIVSTLALMIALGTFYFWNSERRKTPPGDSSFTTRPLQLQAYERLVLFAERISIPSLISRLNIAGAGVREMQVLLLESIKQEYEHNATQQIYVSPVAWSAVKNLKDQNMLIINQVASSLPPEASGAELSRRLLEYAISEKKGELHTVVLEALNYEAKKLMK